MKTRSLIALAVAGACTALPALARRALTEQGQQELIKKLEAAKAL